MNKIATYGSLKQGFHNYGRCGEQTLIGGMTVRGDMTLVHNSYPILSLNPDGDEHEVEVFLVDDITLAQIDAMELGAGYFAIKIATPYGESTMWVMDKEDQYGTPIKAYTKEVLRASRQVSRA